MFKLCLFETGLSVAAEHQGFTFTVGIDTAIEIPLLHPLIAVLSGIRVAYLSAVSVVGYFSGVPLKADPSTLSVALVIDGNGTLRSSHISGNPSDSIESPGPIRG